MRVMNIYAKKGDKVRFAYPDNGRDYDIENAKEHLEPGKEYTIESTSVGQSLTHVYLQEFPGVSFNSVHFEDAKGGNEID